MTDIYTVGVRTGTQEMVSIYGTEGITRFVARSGDPGGTYYNLDPSAVGAASVEAALAGSGDGYILFTSMADSWTDPSHPQPGGSSAGTAQGCQFTVTGRPPAEVYSAVVVAQWDASQTEDRLPPYEDGIQIYVTGLYSIKGFSRAPEIAGQPQASLLADSGLLSDPTNARTYYDAGTMRGIYFDPWDTTLNAWARIPASHTPSRVDLIEIHWNATFTPPPFDAAFIATIEDNGLSVDFDASASSPGVVDYSWDFGDGIPGETDDPRIMHRYLISDTYAVTLTITSATGATATATQYVTLPEGSVTGVIQPGRSTFY